MSAFGIEIKEGCVRLFSNGVTKTEALEQLVESVVATGAVKDADILREAVYSREKAVSTGIGGGVAIPHVRVDSVMTPVLAVGISRKGLDFDAIDGKPVKIVILFAMPADTNKLYLGLLAQVMVALKNTNFFERLVNAETTTEVVNLLNATSA